MAHKTLHNGKYHDDSSSSAFSSHDMMLMFPHTKSSQSPRQACPSTSQHHRDDQGSLKSRGNWISARAVKVSKLPARCPCPFQGNFLIINHIIMCVHYQLSKCCPHLWKWCHLFAKAVPIQFVSLFFVAVVVIWISFLCEQARMIGKSRWQLKLNNSLGNEKNHWVMFLSLYLLGPHNHPQRLLIRGRRRRPHRRDLHHPRPALSSGRSTTP